MLIGFRNTCKQIDRTTALLPAQRAVSPSRASPTTYLWPINPAHNKFHRVSFGPNHTFRPHMSSSEPWQSLKTLTLPGYINVLPFVSLSPPPPPQAAKALAPPPLPLRSQQPPPQPWLPCSPARPRAPSSASAARRRPWPWPTPSPGAG